MLDRLIGIDAGGTMTKAALFELDGTEVACARRSNVMLFPAPGHTERDPERMWEAACSAIRAVLEESGTSPHEIAAVAATGYGAGLYFVDKAFAPVRPGIVSTDSRGVALVAGYQANGLAAWGGERLKQRFWAGQSSILLDWLTRHEPDLVARTYSVLLCKDFLRAKLCGDCSTDATDAGISGLIDVSTGAYAEDVLRELGLGDWIGRLPPIGQPTEIAGRVSAAAAQQTGLLEGTPVVRAVVDVASASLASGMLDPSIMTIVAGTFSINQTLHATPRTSRLPFLQCAYPAHGYYLATEGAATSAGNLEWFCRVMLDAEGARAATQGKSIYEVCERLLCDSLGRGSDLLFFPFLFGGPGGAPAGLVGLTAAHSLADVIRAVYEGVVFAHRMDVDALLAGPDAAKPTRIRLAGGGARSATWPQLFADVLKLPIDVMQCGELGAQGAAMCAATAIGAQPNLEAAMRVMPRILRSYAPDPAKAEMYERKYARFTRVATALAQLASEHPEPDRIAS